MSTPIRPDRLTFPPDHQEPDLSRSDDGNQHGIIPPSERPGSSRFRQSVRQACYCMGSPWFLGSTPIIDLKLHNRGNRVWSQVIKHNRFLSRVNKPCLLNNTEVAVLTIMDMTMCMLTTFINTEKLCRPLRSHEVTLWRYHARLRCSRLRFLFFRPHYLCPLPWCLPTIYLPDDLFR